MVGAHSQNTEKYTALKWNCSGQKGNPEKLGEEDKKRWQKIVKHGNN